MDKVKRHNVCMVSDFFYPNMGGVESHIYQLSQCLISRGHKVVIVTHAYDDRVGVRYLTSCLKVYYLPFTVFYNQCILPTVYTTMLYMRYIFIREQISIVHGHATFSALCHDSLLHGSVMGLKTVFTDHSLFGFADASSIITNKFLEFTLTNVDHVICVSHTSKENTVLRASLVPSDVSVIPNAVDPTVFYPDKDKKKHNRITIVVVSRLVHRKGMDLLAALLPTVCATHSDVDFLIGGDGPKRVNLEETIEKHGLFDRVTFCGNLKHSDVRQVLCRGDIFLNPSLTEAFCIAIVEAVCCGLQVVSTNVGGIPEVLPNHLIRLCPPSVTDLIVALDSAVDDVRQGNIPSHDSIYNDVKMLYRWQDVACRTQKIYDAAVGGETPELADKLKRCLHRGSVCGPIYAILVAIGFLLMQIFDWMYPKEDIDCCPDLTKKHTNDDDDDDDDDDVYLKDNATCR